MALLKSDHYTIVDSRQYTYDDYEQKKIDFLKGIEEEAQVILNKAKEEARQIIAKAYNKGLEKAKIEIESQKAKAKKEGHEEGLLTSKDLVNKENEVFIRKNIAPMADKLQNIVLKYDQEKAKVEEKISSEIVSTALHLAKAILNVEPEFNEKVIELRIQKAISYLKIGMDLQIRIHPEDYAHAKKYFTELLEKMGRETSLVWKEDASLGRGDIIVIGGEAQVKIDSVEQWETVLKELKLEAHS